jgi:hypothetical protein
MEGEINIPIPPKEGYKADGGRAGDLICQEDEVEVRTFPRDDEAHSVWIGEKLYVLGREIFEECVLRTPPCKMEEQLRSYNPAIIESLKRINLSPEGLGLVLAHALIYKHAGIEKNLAANAQRLRLRLKQQTVGG